MDVVPAALDLADLTGWNPTLLVHSAGGSSTTGSLSLRVIYAASVAKQFTGFLAALLVTEGHWRAADQIRSLVPELPSWAEGIEVQHLVHHTVGCQYSAQHHQTLIGRSGYWAVRPMTSSMGCL
jgi:CubicO group peptidase (beta-lactamase class C family)